MTFGNKHYSPEELEKVREEKKKQAILSGYSRAKYARLAAKEQRRKR